MAETRLIVQSGLIHAIGTRIPIYNDSIKYWALITGTATKEEYLASVKNSYPDWKQEVWCEYFYVVVMD